ncbi:MAG: PEP-utilizing enzyme [Candidatus Limnocylindrales bacterium]
MSLPPPAGAEAVGFPVAWPDPSDAELTWDLDDMHMPFALSPLAGDYSLAIGMGWASRYTRLGLPITVRTAMWNGYMYFALRYDAPEAEHDGIETRVTALARDHAGIARRYWDHDARPELDAIYGRLGDLTAATMTLTEARDAWIEAWALVERVWRIHFYAIIGPYQVLDDLADLYDAVVTDASPGEALRLLGGSIDVLHEVEAGLRRLTGLALAEPALAARLIAPDAPALDDLAGLPGYAAFCAAWEAMLAAHGHLGQGFDDLALASWAEEPRQLMAELAVRVRRGVVAPAGRAAGLSSDADALADKVRDLLADRPAERGRFEALLELARQVGPLTEAHNYWIDRKVQALLRRFVLHIGALLMDAGVLAEAADVLYLYRDEVPALLQAPADRRDLVLRRRGDHAAWRLMRAPRQLGKIAPPSANRFEGARLEPDADDQLRGTGASAGIVRGPARVTLSTSDFGRVQPGDIIVCPSSNPSWVPVFTIAGGLVTNTGGVLSHAAVVAREFGLPAVVGVVGATTRIADGRTLEIDGTLGIVRLL